VFVEPVIAYDVQKCNKEYMQRSEVVLCSVLAIFDVGLTKCILSVNNYYNRTFVAVVDPRTHISFLFTRCRYLSIFDILLLTDSLGLN